MSSSSHQVWDQWLMSMDTSGQWPFWHTGLSAVWFRELQLNYSFIVAHLSLIDPKLMVLRFFSRVNGQYIMEGLASSFLFTMGGLGFIILDRSNAPNIPKLNRFLLLFIGFVSVLLSFFMARVFMRMKLP